MSSNDFSTTFTVDRAPAEVFAVINDVRGWWHGDIEGVTDVLGEEFTYRHQDLHSSTQRIVELAATGSGTQVCFTHAGLVPDLECFQDCSNAWGHYVNGSLRGVLDAGRTGSEASPVR